MSTEDTPEPGTDLIPHPLTGEAIALKAASTAELAAWRVRSDDYRADLGTFDRALEGELLARMDKAATWTHRVGDPKADVNLELTAPSPTAGTTSYNPATLEQGLRTLVEADVLDPEALEEAVPRTVTITADGRDTRKLEAYAERAGATVTATTRAAIGAIKKLRSIGHPDVNAAIEEAEETTPVSSRRVKIKRIEKAKVKRA